MTALENPTVSPAITLTSAAKAQITYLMSKQNRTDLYLRVAVKGGGCSGLSYVLGLEETPTDKDHILEIDEFRLLVDKKSARFVDGLTLNYSVQKLLEGGWEYHNPNAQRSCGCGTSFTPK